MKMFLGNNEERSFEGFGFEVLNENEMLKIRGGDSQPKSRDLDAYDEEDED